MDSPIPPDPYQALGLAKTATGDEIRKAYRKLALRLHPDKCNDESLKPQRTDEFHLVQQAYDIIGDEDRRLRYDAQIRLAELKRQNLELRSQTSRSAPAPVYGVRTAVPKDASYATRGSTRAPFEETRRERYYEDDYAPRASAKKTTAYDEYHPLPPKRDPPPRDRETERARAKLDQEAEERRRKEKKRDAAMRESRSSKYDTREIYEEDRKAESRRPPMTRNEEYGSSSTERKMEERKREAERHILEREQRSARPSVYGRTSSSREIPLPYEVRRSAAPPKERERMRESESARRSSPGRGERRRNVENMDPYERPIPNLATHNSSPPVMEQPPQLRHAYTSPADYDGQRSSKEASPPPSFHRSTTMPVPSSIPPRRKDSTVPSSRLRHAETVSPDSGYSSPAATPNYSSSKSYASGYPAYAEDKASTSPPRHFNTVIAEPGSTSRRRTSTSPVRTDARPSSSTAAKMASLDPKRYPTSSSARKTTYAYPKESATARPSVLQSASTRAVPRRSETDRGRDRERERDQDYRYGSDERLPRGDKLYGESRAGPVPNRYEPPTQFPEGSIRYAKNYDISDVKFSGGSSRPGERVLNEFTKPRLGRSTTYAY